MNGRNQDVELNTLPHNSRGECYGCRKTNKFKSVAGSKYRLLCFQNQMGAIGEKTKKTFGRTVSSRLVRLPNLNPERERWFRKAERPGGESWMGEVGGEAVAGGEKNLAKTGEKDCLPGKMNLTSFTKFVVKIVLLLSLQIFSLQR